MCFAKDSRILLTSVFGPYGQDDEFGSRAINPMELYQNQVTRCQGPFSLRMFHRSWGIMLIQANVEAPCTVLDFPTLERFVAEIKLHRYDVVGITAITPNLLKVKKMCELVREFLPKAKIVVGGHIANIPDLKEQVGSGLIDFVVKGDGVAWFREKLGQKIDAPIWHPVTDSGIKPRSCGMNLSTKPGDVAVTLIPSVGCPMGCNFCSTSSMFGGKGKCVHFYATGDELFHVMNRLEELKHVNSFFVMDENFLLQRKRALRLLELMEENDKAWSLYVFTSANVLKSYTIDELIRLGVSWVWMGIEEKNSQYSKLEGVDTFKLVRELQSHGIRVLGSSIIGLESHTKENIDEAIEYAVRHDTDFHQFMLYTPIPGTPLFAELETAGKMRNSNDYDGCDIHGQFILPYHHSAFTDEDTPELMVKAFTRDYEVNGPSVCRIVRTTLAGWRKYKNHSDLRVRRRFQQEAKDLAVRSSALIKGAMLYHRNNPVVYKKLASTLSGLYAEFGWKARLVAFFGGRYVLGKIRQEEARLAEGFSYEPPAFYECNRFVKHNREVILCNVVAPL